MGEKIISQNRNGSILCPIYLGDVFSASGSLIMASAPVATAKKCEKCAQ